jgi:hypothetical protein
MTQTRAMSAFCGAQTRSGGQCRRPAGWGTDHVGSGSCKLHNGCTASGKAAAARAAAPLIASGMGIELDVSPIDLLLTIVRMTAGQIAHATREVSELDRLHDDAGRPVFWLQMQIEALRRGAQFSKMALDAGVAERQVRLAERVGAMLSGALEDALNGEDLPAEARARIVERFSGGLALLEAGEPG